MTSEAQPNPVSTSVQAAEVIRQLEDGITVATSLSSKITVISTITECCYLRGIDPSKCVPFLWEVSGHEPSIGLPYCTEKEWKKLCSCLEGKFTI